MRHCDPRSHPAVLDQLPPVFFINLNEVVDSLRWYVPTDRIAAVVVIRCANSFGSSMVGIGRAAWSRAWWWGPVRKSGEWGGVSAVLMLYQTGLRGTYQARRRKRCH